MTNEKRASFFILSRTNSSLLFHIINSLIYARIERPDYDVSLPQSNNEIYVLFLYINIYVYSFVPSAIHNAIRCGLVENSSNLDFTRSF